MINYQLSAMVSTDLNSGKKLIFLVEEHIVKQMRKIWRGNEGRGLPSGWDGMSKNKQVRQVFGGTMS